jgi:hypothetical protein
MHFFFYCHGGCKFMYSVSGCKFVIDFGMH